MHNAEQVMDKMVNGQVVYESTEGGETSDVSKAVKDVSANGAVVPKVVKVPNPENQATGTEDPRVQAKAKSIARRIMLTIGCKRLDGEAAYWDNTNQKCMVPTN